MPDPWFKLYSTEFLLDSRVNDLPLQAQAILVRMWCVIHQTGAIPDDPVKVARLIGVSHRTVVSCWSEIRLMFASDPSDSRLIRSSRMDDERLKSARKAEAHRTGANKTNEKRWGKGSGEASLSDRPKEEDEEEDKDKEKKEPKGSSCAEPAAQDSTPVALLLPCVGKGPKEWPVTEGMLAKWKDAYPALDPLAEAKRMKLWLEGNPTKRKTAAGMARFTLSWLGRAQDSPKLTTSPTKGLINGTRTPAHRRATDEAYQQHLAEHPAPPPPTEPDEEVLQMFERAARG